MDNSLLKLTEDTMAQLLKDIISYRGWDVKLEMSKAVLNLAYARAALK